jgi:hypothetical protein
MKTLRDQFHTGFEGKATTGTKTVATAIPDDMLTSGSWTPERKNTFRTWLESMLPSWGSLSNVEVADQVVTWLTNHEIGPLGSNPRGFGLQIYDALADAGLV